MTRHAARFAAWFRRLVAAHHVEALAIGRGDDAVRSMLACFAWKGAEQFHRVELIIAIRVLAAVEAAALIRVVIHHAVKRSRMKKQALTVTEVDSELLHLRVRGFRAGCDAIQRSILIAANQATFVILRHRDPRAFLFLRNGVKQLDLEALGDFDFLHGRRLRGDLRETGRAGEEKRDEDGFHGWWRGGPGFCTYRP